MKMVDTCYGQKVLIDFGESNYFLPTKFNKFPEEVLASIQPNEMKMSITRKGNDVFYNFEK